MKNNFYLFLILFGVILLACENTAKPAENQEPNKDYFKVKYVLDGQSKEKNKSYKTERVKAVYLKSLNKNPASVVNLSFPVFTETFILNVQAGKPGTYKVPRVDLHKEDLSFSFGISENGENYQLAFEAVNVDVQIESIELKANPAAKTDAGSPVDGYANIKGTFKGTFMMEKRGKGYVATPGEGPKGEKVEVSGEFRSGENF